MRARRDRQGEWRRRELIGRAQAQRLRGDRHNRQGHQNAEEDSERKPASEFRGPLRGFDDEMARRIRGALRLARGALSARFLRGGRCGNALRIPRIRRESGGVESHLFMLTISSVVVRKGRQKINI